MFESDTVIIDMFLKVIKWFKHQLFLRIRILRDFPNVIHLLELPNHKTPGIFLIPIDSTIIIFRYNNSPNIKLLHSNIEHETKPIPFFFHSQTHDSKRSNRKK